MTNEGPANKRRKHSRIELTRRVLRSVTSHPANQQSRFRSVVRSGWWQISKQFPPSHRTFAAYGLRLNLPTAAGGASNLKYFGEYFEWDSLQFVDRYLRPGDLVVDVGANIGLFSFACARAVNGLGSIVAFEPVAWAAESMRQNVVSNELTDLIAVCEAAVGAEPGVLEFTTDLDVSNHLVYTAGKSISRAATRVPVTTIDIELQDSGTPSLVKIDVEGAEMLTLSGMSRLLADPDRHPWVVLIEAHDHALRKMGSSRSEVLARLEEHGYSLCSYDVALNRLVPTLAESSDVLAVAHDRREQVEVRLHAGVGRPER